MALHTSFLSLSPQVRRHGDSLIIRTGLMATALSLGLWRRTLDVNTQHRLLTLSDSILYLWRTERAYRFDAVQTITYGYGDEAGAAEWLAWGHDTVDNFSVGVRLKDDREIQFFSFLGAGEFHHDGTFPDWCYWDEYVFDFAGTQEATSRLLVDLLCKIIGVTVMPPRH